MLTVFNSFRVPGVPYVEVYRNALDPHQFHLLADRPRIAVDNKTGLPLFSYTLFSRNIEIAYASAPEGQPVETQLGSLMLTCDLSVSPEEWERIRLYLVQLLREERQRPSQYNKLFRLVPTSDEPIMGYANTWTQGTVKMEMLEQMGPTFKRSSSEERSPQLRGTMVSALWANFGTEGAQLMWDALHPASPNGATTSGSRLDIPLQANIRYDLTGVARTPALHVEIHADGGPIYTELRNRQQVYERVGNATWSYPQVSELTKELVDKRMITIDWKDYGIPNSDPDSAELKKQLQSTVLGLVTQKIVEICFRQVTATGLKDEDLGKTFTHTRDGIPGSRLWLNKFEDKNTVDIDFVLNYESNHTFEVHPQVSVLAAMTPQQRDKLVRVVDVGSPEVRVLSVPIYTNADFAGDKIANITTTLSYKQYDHLVGDWIEKTEPFVFKKGDETFTFRTRLARDEQGRLIDKYDAKAQVNYIGTSQTPSPIELRDISERALTFSYDRLGYVNVEVQAGDINWQEIQKVYVDLVYEAAQSHPDAKGTIELNPEKLEDRWTTSKHGQTSNGYRYTVRYVFHSGEEVTAKPASDERGTLVVHDPLVGRLRKTFDVSLDPQTVEHVTLKVRYERPGQEPEETRNVFTSTGSWEYVRTLTEGASRELKYSWSVQYKDGLSEDDTPWQALGADADPPSITARRYRVPVLVDGEGLDWSQYRTVYVTITYRDDDHGYEKVEELRLNQGEPMASVEMFGFSPRARTYEYAAMLVPRDGSDPVEINGNGTPLTRTGPLLLETLV
ncbi:MAG TPA: hypothetical protein VN213_16915 [Solirubrobacteraceae bacterium]|nr:hypothetical protein [Solirubrobacteraceae bacterium]